MEATTLELHEPGMAHVKFYTRLKQMLTQAQLDIEKDHDQINDIAGKEVKSISEAKDDTEKELQGFATGFGFIINASHSVDAAQFLSTFEKMVLMPLEGQARPICRVSDSVIMTRPLWDKLHPDDAFAMATRWCAFFAMPSTEGAPTISEQQPESVVPLTVA